MLTEWTQKAIASNYIEAKIVRKVVKALRDAGTPVVNVWDGEEDTPVKTTDDVLNVVFNLDEARLETEKSFVFLVCGNEWDMLSDYGVSLEDALKPVNDWIMKHSR